MNKKRYITIQILPDDSSAVWTIKLRYRFFEFLFYAIILALFATALAAVKITEINGKVFAANHLAVINRELRQRQQKMTLLEKELDQMAEQERKIRGILQTFIAEKGADTTGDGNAGTRMSAADIDKFISQVRALDRKRRGSGAFPARDQIPDIWPTAGIISQKFNAGSTPGQSAAAGAAASEGAAPGEAVASAEARHDGVDIIAEGNALVAAAAAGIVIQAGQDRDLGRFVKIDHDHGVQTLYAHLSRSFVQAGDHVEKGVSIGAVGNTGNSFGPHLHYEILIKGKAVDPEQYLK
ncbi:MAG: M23 family metallopeptidase [Fibrobacteres bacterium]|nr:M23 family metallopeptidase [Fibrobacterota bacterium]